jgi:cysteinyl-tRNA synthetase
VDLSHPVLGQFAAAIADDLNIAGALGAILPWAATTPEHPAEALGVLNRINDVLAVAPLATTGAAASDDAESQILSLCLKLDQARASKDFASADKIRSEITAAGYDVKTSPQGTVARKRLA